MCFSFTSSRGVGYLMVCTANYPNVLAFCFLDELQKEFIVTYDTKRIRSAMRPYSFIEFGELHGVLHVLNTMVNFMIYQLKKQGRPECNCSWENIKKKKIHCQTSICVTFTYKATLLQSMLFLVSVRIIRS